MFLQDSHEITPGYAAASYSDFLSSELKNTERIAISQSINNGKLSAIFGKDSRYSESASGWWLASEHKKFLEHVKEERSEGRHVFSLACDDDLGFGVYTLGDFGTDQGVAWDLGEPDLKEWWDNGYMITACGARDSRFYYVMTRGAKGFERGIGQSWAKQSTWNEVKKYISEKWKEGMIITGICYSTGLKQYLVIMTESSEGQDYKWESEGISEWMDEQYEKKHHPTIIFTDPIDQDDFVVMTTDKNRSGYRKLHITLKE